MLQGAKDKLQRNITKPKAADMKIAEEKVKELNKTFEKCNKDSDGVVLPGFILSLHSQVMHESVHTLLTSPGGEPNAVDNTTPATTRSEEGTFGFGC